MCEYVASELMSGVLSLQVQALDTVTAEGRGADSSAFSLSQCSLTMDDRQDTLSLPTSCSDSLLKAPQRLPRVLRIKM